MAKVRMLRDFDYKITPRAVIALKAGWEGTTKREVANAAVAAGAAESLDPPAPTEPASAASEAAVDGA